MFTADELHAVPMPLSTVKWCHLVSARQAHVLVWARQVRLILELAWPALVTEVEGFRVARVAPGMSYGGLAPKHVAYSTMKDTGQE